MSLIAVLALLAIGAGSGYGYGQKECAEKHGPQTEVTKLNLK